MTAEKATAMKDRPILFSAPMVKAILEGRKTQTRRIVKPQLEMVRFVSGEVETPAFTGKLCAPGIKAVGINIFNTPGNSAMVKCPYGVPGERLWCRETWRRVCSGVIEGGEGAIRYGIQYRADNFIRWNERETVMSGGWKDTETPMQFRDPPWKPCIHIRRSDSRLTLEITGVRVERLQEITPSDCLAEGIILGRAGSGMPCFKLSGEDWGNDTARGRYAALWESINGKGSWDKNEWVWVVEFRKITK